MPTARQGYSTPPGQPVRDAGARRLNLAKGTVGTSAVLLIGENPDRLGLLITNSGSVILTIGDADVQADANYDIAAGGTFPTTYVGALWGIVASGTTTYSLAEESI